MWVRIATTKQQVGFTLAETLIAVMAVGTALVVSTSSPQPVFEQPWNAIFALGASAVLPHGPDATCTGLPQVVLTACEDDAGGKRPPLRQSGASAVDLGIPPLHVTVSAPQGGHALTRLVAR